MSERYKNTYGWCRYPYQDKDAIDYCWGYANMIDKDATKKEILKMCKGCDYYE